MSAIILAAWNIIKPHVMLVTFCTALAVGSFATGYHLARPKLPVNAQVAQAEAQIRQTQQLHIDSILTRQKDSLAQRLAQETHERAGIDGILSDLRHRLSSTSHKADSLGVIASDTTPEPPDTVTVASTRPDSELAHLTRFVASCDTLKTSCEAYRDTAEAFKLATHATIQSLTTFNKTLQAAIPSKVHTTSLQVTAAVLGWLVGHFIR